MAYRTFDEGAAAWEAARPLFEQNGVHLDAVRTFICENWKRDYRGAVDALPDLLRNGMISADALPAISTDPNSSVPTMLTTMIDPQIYRVVFSPVKAAEVMGEVQKGTWLDQTIMFPIVEQTGEVSSYGDFNENGNAGANSNFPQRQSYLFQTICEYGELGVARAGLARINWMGEVDAGGLQALMRFLNYSYFFGVQGLQNYGLLNDPALPAALTPATKAYGGVKWVNNGAIVATANEILLDVQAMVYQLVTQTEGVVEYEDAMTLAMAPNIKVALTATNSFGLNAMQLITAIFPKMKVVTAPQYGALSTQNSQGVAAGNTVQLFADAVGGQKTGYCAYNEKARAHPVVRQLSSWKKKVTAGTWGFINRYPAGIVQMVGV